MKIDRIQITDFRNIAQLDLKFCENANMIYGDNGHGKTNLIEAIWLFTGAKSFRGARDAQLVRFDCPRAKLQIDFFAAQREQNAQIVIESKRSALLNEIPLSSPTGLAGSLCAVVFSPTHLSLLKNGPQEKRKFLDTAICQIKPRFIHLLAQYTRVLDQRNRLLKDLMYDKTGMLADTLEIWDERLASLAAVIIKTRASFLQKLLPEAQKTYAGISKGREELSFSYVSTLACDWSAPTAEMEKVLLDGLRACRNEDIKMRMTGAGPHRDDVEISLDGASARVYGSQGQQRSCVLALKLAECELIRETMGEYPVVLLDDVMSELDVSRREYLLNHLSGRQLIMTCCDKAYFKTLGRGIGVRMKEGAAVSCRSY